MQDPAKNLAASGEYGLHATAARLQAIVDTP
jgi:hypothetical protein